MRAALIALTLSAPATVFASGSLTISLQDDRSRAIEGTATAAPDAGGATRTCTTHGGRCTITGLAPGQYRVSATLVRGSCAARSVRVVDGRTSAVRLTSSTAPTAPVTSSTLRGSTPTQGSATASDGATAPRPDQSVAPRSLGHLQVGPSGTIRGSRVQGLPAGASVRESSNVPTASPTPTGGPALMTASSTSAPTSHDLGTGSHVRITGVAQDQRSRHVEGTVTVRQGTTSVGQVSTTGGSFSIFDLAPGSYSLTFAALSGQRTSRSVTVGSGPAISVRFQITR